MSIDHDAHRPAAGGNNAPAADGAEMSLSELAQATLRQVLKPRDKAYMEAMESARRTLVEIAQGKTRLARQVRRALAQIDAEDERRRRESEADHERWRRRRQEIEERIAAVEAALKGERRRDEGAMK
jgi:hypothetical protein